MSTNTNRTQTSDRYQGLSTLMERYLDGDQRAFSQLYHRLSPMVRGHVRSKISDQAAAEDLVQATFMKAHGARGRYAVPEGASPDRAVAVWYATIARNATIDHLRKIYRERAVRVETSSDSKVEFLDAVRDPGPDSEAIAIEGERQHSIAGRIRQALAGLPASQREVVTMHKLEGKSMAEISEQLGVREGTLRVRAHRGYKALANMLGGYRAATPVAA